jgi:hypothetical protein
VDAAPKPAASFADAVRSLEFLFRGGSADAGTQAYVRQRLRGDLQTALAELPGDDFTIEWILSNFLPCLLAQADAAQAATMWNAMERAIIARPANPFTLSMAIALRRRPAPPGQLQRITDAMADNPSCAVRAAAVVLQRSARSAQAALRSSCWMLQATALRTLEKLGVAPDPTVRLPSFLRRP